MQTSEPRSEKRVIIVGAGAFGLSTAYHLLQDNHSSTERTPGRPTYKVTVIEASSTLPAPDAASSDLNKVVRTSYSDKFYTLLAKEAISLWKQGNICGKDTYHESGVVVLGVKKYDAKGDPSENAYANLGLQNDIEAGANVKLFPNPADIRTALPKDIVFGPLFDVGSAYLNADGGWASASKAVEALFENVKALGGQVIAGSKMTSLMFGEKPDRVAGVMLEDGRVEYGDIIVLAMGAWTPSVVGGIESLRSVVNNSLTATGQTLATIRLSPSLAERYRDVPVLLDWSTGFYVFPPNEENVVKFAIHTEGHTYTPVDANLNPATISASTPAERTVSIVSRPRTTRTHGPQGTSVPRQAMELLHGCLKTAYPELAQLPLETTRLCWYTDTPDEDWMIDEVPQHPGLFLATGGSGHAFKFLPVLGRLVKDRIEGRMKPSVAAKFAIGRNFTVLHEAQKVHSRHGSAKELEEGSLFSAKDYNEYIRQ